jgi:hypothetical protein
MKKIGLFAVGFILAIGLLAGAPGTAKATTANVVIDLGISNTVLGSGTITANEVGFWELEGFKNQNPSSFIGATLITGGAIEFNPGAKTIEFSGNVVGGGHFDVTGALTHFSTPSPTISYYSGVVDFPSLATLSNFAFSLKGPYAGSVSIDQNAAGVTSGISTASMNVSSVPVPPSVLLLAPGLLGLVGMRKRLKG